MIDLIGLVFILSFLPTAVLSLLVALSLELTWRWRMTKSVERPFRSTILTGAIWGGLFEIVHATSLIFQGGGASGALFSLLLTYGIIPLSTAMAALFMGMVYLKRGRPFHIPRQEM